MKLAHTPRAQQLPGSTQQPTYNLLKDPLYSSQATVRSTTKQGPVFPTPISSSQFSNDFHNQLFVSQTKTTTKTTPPNITKMSFNMNFNEESNVAYLGTSEDLEFGGYGGFLKEGADMQLFGGFEETPSSADRALFQSLSAYNNSVNPATVSPQELSMAPPQSASIPSSANIPELTPAESLLYYTPEVEGLPWFSNSVDPSPLLQDDMAPPTVLQHGDSLFAAEDPKPDMPKRGVPSCAELMRQTTDSLPPTPRSAVLGPAPSGVRKPGSRKATRPLKDINLDLITDEKERKKAKNTEAARRSRAKKADHEAALEAKIAELQRELAMEKAKNEQLQAYIKAQPM